MHLESLRAQTIFRDARPRPRSFTAKRADKIFIGCVNWFATFAGYMTVTKWPEGFGGPNRNRCSTAIGAVRPGVLPNTHTTAVLLTKTCSNSRRMTASTSRIVT